MILNPYLSIIVTSRNDDHGGNQLQRFQTFLDHFAKMSDRHSLSAELIVVEWNPDPNRARLKDVLQWPVSTTLDIRIITVPPRIHVKHDNSDKFPLFQMIAKNVGIRRARGDFILATNIDVLLSDELCAFLARKELDPDCFYRIDRHDICLTTIPKEISWEERMRLCSKSVIRVQGQFGSYEWGMKPPTGDPDKLHTNACGDFTLLSREKWIELKGYPEFHLWSIFIDGLLIHAAQAIGMNQLIINEPCRLYHIEHNLGWAKPRILSVNDPVWIIKNSTYLYVREY